LIYLAKFYDIQGYQHWEQVDAESSSEGIPGDRQTSSSGQTPEDAVERYPYIAVEVLASLIGLNEEHSINFRARASELRERPQPQAGKRIVTTRPEEARRQKKNLSAPPRPPESLPSAILKNKDFPRSQRSWKSPHSEPSEQPMVT
jgi:hypothetical protein